MLALAASALAVSSISGQDLVLRNANVVDVVTGDIAPEATVVVRAGIIASIDADGGEVPAGIRTIDLAGRYVAPGLMDGHVHVESDADARRALFSGVTTMRSMGASHYVDVGMRELQRAGFATTPEYLAAGYHIRPQMAEGFFQDHPELGGLDGGAVTGADAVRSVTRALLSMGVDFVKTNATERAGLPDTDPRKQLFDDVELGVMVEEARRAGIGTIAIVRDLTIPGGDYDNAVLNIRGRHMLPRVQEMAGMAHDLGVKIVAATDTGYGPNSTTTLAHELLELVEIGMSPLEALRAATTTAAELFGLDTRAGRLEEGYEADLIVLERNPLEDIGVVQDVLMVVSDGAVIVQRGDWPGRPES
jgi:imidazolonepropionase-like amidohydrolase